MARISGFQSEDEGSKPSTPTKTIDALAVMFMKIEVHVDERMPKNAIAVYSGEKLVGYIFNIGAEA